MATCTGRDGDRWEIYRNNRGEWEWRRRAAGNNRIVGASAEGYVRRASCIANARRNGMDCNPE